MSGMEDKLKRVIEIVEELEVRKALYTEFDRLVLELVSEGFTTARVNDLVLNLKDNFASGNTGWTSAAVKRYDIEVISKELAEKRARKAK